jgi:hypothetical protein
MAHKDRWFLLVIHLDKTDVIPELLEVFTANDISGCTIFNSKGVGHTHFVESDAPLIASLKRLMGSDTQYNKTIFSVIEGKERLEKTMLGIENTVKDFCEPDIGLMYAMPLLHVRGYRVETGDDQYECKI